MTMNRFYLIIFLLICLSTQGRAQETAVKTNLLYGGLTRTPNLSVEFGLGKRSTLELGGGYNWFTPSGRDDKKLVHWLTEAEYRYWLCRKFNGHFLGIHALGAQYNIGGHKLPLLLGNDSKDHRYEGWAVGGGISYGYSFYLSTRWSLEATIGLGYARLINDKFECATCGRKLGPEKRNYLGPTKAGISLIYIIK